MTIIISAAASFLASLVSVALPWLSLALVALGIDAVTP